VAKLTKDFDIPMMTLTAVLKNKDKIISEFFPSKYTRKRDTVSGSHDQRTPLALARVGHSTPF